MGTGIVSVALSLGHWTTASQVVLVLAASSWVILAAVLGVRLVRDRSGVLAEARSPVGLTAVAATAVLGARLAAVGARVETVALLILAAAAWLGLGAVLVRNRRLPRTGSVFMLTVSVQSLAVLAAVISTPEHAPWLLDAALAACAIGLVLYPFALARFDVHELRSGAGDHWVAGGALAISALATSEISLAAGRLTTLTAVVPALRVISVLIWAASMLWLLALVGAEILHHEFDMTRGAGPRCSRSGCTRYAASKSPEPPASTRSRGSRPYGRG
jgi:hypothetical protein